MLDDIVFGGGCPNCGTRNHQHADNCPYDIKNQLRKIELELNGGNELKKINCTIADPNLLPKYETPYASGMDLKAYSYTYPSNLKIDNGTNEEWEITLMPLKRILIKTGLHIELPLNVEAQIRPRSGLALKNGISIVNSPGTIDMDYRGNIGVVLINLGEEPFKIKKGDKIAQMVFQNVEQYNLNVVDELSDTVRGEGGFGHTGV